MSANTLIIALTIAPLLTSALSIWLIGEVADFFADIGEAADLH